MPLLGTIDGLGRLLSQGKTLGDVSYSISVFQSGTVRSAHGQIVGHEAALTEATMSGVVTLVLKDGKAIQVHVNKGQADKTARVTVSGPVPGF